METIVLVPGIGLGGAELLVLQWRLRRCGYQTKIFWTNPWRGTLAEKAKALHAMLVESNTEAANLVGHSFGGRVILQMLNDFPECRLGRIVTLGSPLTACTATDRILRLPGGRWVVGETVTVAATQPQQIIPSGREVGSVAGRLNFLVGLVLCPRKSNDSIIGVDETRHPDLKDHRTLFVSHTGMLTSKRVSDHVVRFLHSGNFPSDLGAT